MSNRRAGRILERGHYYPWCGALVAVAAVGLAAVAAIPTDDTTPTQRAVAVALHLAVGALVLWRCERTGVIDHGDVLEVRNVCRTRSIPWSEVARFEVAEWFWSQTYFATVVAVTTSGRRVRLSATATMSAHRVELIADDLEATAAEHGVDADIDRRLLRSTWFAPTPPDGPGDPADRARS